MRLLVGLVIWAPILAWAQPSPQDANIEKPVSPYSFSSYTPLQNSKKAANYLFSNTGLIILGAGTGSGVLIHQWDADINNHYSKKNRFGNWDSVGNEALGTGVPGALSGIGFWYVGARLQNAKAMHAGQAQLEALVGTALTTFLVKGVSQRQRPDGSNKNSFPSGHTSTVFASAATLHQFYGWKLGVPLYALGVFTAMSRWSEGVHWASDTVAGATIGVWMGYSFAMAHMGSLRSDDFVFVPDCTEDRVGLRFAMQF